MTRAARVGWLVMGLCVGTGVAQSKPYQYIRLGNVADVTAKTQAGFALMGGGEDLDAAFRWMCAKAGGGDFLILRAGGTDAYNPYVKGLCPLNSVATLIMPTKAAAMDPETAKIISQAEAVFISGGDQSDYTKNWRGTPVQDAINAAIARGVPVGGTSAGLAVQGEFIYTAENDGDLPNLGSDTALANPFDRQVVVLRGFLKNPLMEDVITDSHFVVRDRMGRLLAMMARILEDGAVKQVHGMGVDQETAVLLEPDGHATVVGKGAVYFLSAEGKPAVVKPGTPLGFGPVSAVKVTAGGSFDVKTWIGGGTPYAYVVKSGVLTATSPGGAIY